MSVVPIFFVWLLLVPAVCTGAVIAGSGVHEGIQTERLLSMDLMELDTPKDAQWVDDLPPLKDVEEKAPSQVPPQGGEAEGVSRQTGSVSTPQEPVARDKGPKVISSPKVLQRQGGPVAGPSPRTLKPLSVPSEREMGLKIPAAAKEEKVAPDSREMEMPLISNEPPAFDLKVMPPSPPEKGLKEGASAEKAAKTSLGEEPGDQEKALDKELLEIYRTFYQ